MRKKNPITTSAYVFLKWSRKGYAIFASLKKIINIGRLTVDLCCTAQLKNQNLINLLTVDEFEERNEEQTDNEEKVGIVELLLQNYILNTNSFYFAEKGKTNSFISEQTHILPVAVYGFVLFEISPNIKYRKLKNQ